jgi:hypothetical protein
MNNKNLLASIALFGELYKSDKKESLWDILADYIKGAVSFENRYTLTSVEVKELLSKVYGFNKIPESVIRTTLKSKLKNCARLENGSYNFETSCADTNRTIENVDEINKKQQSVLEKLYCYILDKKNLTKAQLSKDDVWEQLSKFLLDNDCTDDFPELISSFIIHNNNGENDCLNQIKEGLILYNGLCDSETEDINQLGSWKNELTIYLSTEHLFNSAGFNGDVYKDIFDDFKNLINEINHSEKGGNKKGIIHLKYFEETKKEIDNFFVEAENVVKYHQNFDQTRTAMVSILKGCKRIDDVKEKQAKFYVTLKQKNIEIQEYSFDRIKPDYNIVDDNLIKELKKESDTNHKSFDEDGCLRCLQIFSKINSQRKGVNNVSLEKVKYIYVTEKSLALYLGHSNKVKFNDTDISFAKDIDYVITKFWFKLNKGFGRNTTLPKSLDVLTRARLVISSHINNSLSEKYDELNKKIKDGSLTQEEAIVLYNQYKETPSLPENINSTNIDDTFAFLYDDDFIENHLREKAKQEQTRQEQEVKFQKTESENLIIKAENEEIKFENQSLKEKNLYYEQKEKEREEITNKKRIEKESNEYAEDEWNKSKKTYRTHTRYMFFVFLISLLPISVGLGLSICQSIKTYLNSISENYLLFVVLGIIIIYVIEGFGSKYIFDKEKVKNGWKYLFNSKSIKKGKFEKLKKYYIENQSNK